MEYNLGTIYCDDIRLHQNTVLSCPPVRSSLDATVLLWSNVALKQQYATRVGPRDLVGPGSAARLTFPHHPTARHARSGGLAGEGGGGEERAWAE